MSLSRKLFLVIGVLSMVIVGVTAGAYFSNNYLISGFNRFAEHDGQQQEMSMEAIVQFDEAFRVYQSYFMDKDPKYRDEFVECIKKGLSYLDVYEKLTDESDPVEKELAKKVRALVADFERAGEKVFGSKEVSKELRSSIEGIRVPLKEVLEEMDERAMKSYADGIKSLESNSFKLKIALTLAALLACGFGIGFSFVIIRQILGSVGAVNEVAKKASGGDLSKEAPIYSKDEIGEMAASFNQMIRSLREMVGRVNSATVTVTDGSKELSQTVQNINERIGEQSNRASQAAASSTEMSQTVIDVARNASNIAASATEAMKTAREGKEIVDGTVNEVQEIASTVSGLSGAMSSLGDRSKQIGEILNVIRDIAEQTNLLALNAAIEAARAGEQGRGFAVVADEVKKLAERTAKSTVEIGTIINTVQQETESAAQAMKESLERVYRGADLSRQAGESLARIVSSVNDLQGMVQQIASSTEEMSAVAEGINSDIDMIASISRETSVGTDQITSKTIELARLSSNLQGLTGQFRVA